MKLLATAVFEGVIYSARLVDGTNPDRLSLMVDAVLRPGDADDGPLLMPVPELAVHLTTPVARRLLPRYERDGRIVDHHGVRHVAFPFWEPAGPDQSWRPVRPG
ncbi:MAG: hypothetical protein OES57_16965 [Acidimicrobiia bacterium]|nr:hypothetical protein [Acidimicrobiia bacterium]